MATPFTAIVSPVEVEGGGDPEGTDPSPPPPVAESLETAPVRVEIEPFDARAHLVSDYKYRRYLIAPNGTFRKMWDVLVIFALAFTASVTPFEVAFLDSYLGPLFGINRVVDFVFLVDTVANFFTPVMDAKTGLWITTHRAIAMRYFRFWFWIDAISLIPFDAIGVASDSSNVANLQGLRLIRLLRLLKLLRIFRTSRILKRWEVWITWKHSSVQLLTFFITVIVMCHWIACLMGLLPILEGADYMGQYTEYEIATNAFPVSWVTIYFEKGLGVTDYNVWSVYLAGYYYAVMTSSTIGYGDVTPKTDAERGVVCCIMLFGATLYAYIVGVCVAIVSSLNPVRNDFEAQMDDIADMMREADVDPETKRKVRKFIFFSYRKMKDDCGKALLDEYLTPHLRDEISYLRMKKWINHLPFVHKIPEQDRSHFLTALASGFTTEALPPLERLVSKGEAHAKLYFVEGGSVLVHDSDSPLEERPATQISPNVYARASISKSSAFYAAVTEKRGPGGEREGPSCFGFEMVTSSGDVPSDYNVTTLTYCDLLVLSKEYLEEVFERFPVVRKALRG